MSIERSSSARTRSLHYLQLGRRTRERDASVLGIYPPAKLPTFLQPLSELQGQSRDRNREPDLVRQNVGGEAWTTKRCREREAVWLFVESG